MVTRTSSPISYVITKILINKLYSTEVDNLKVWITVSTWTDKMISTWIFWVKVNHKMIPKCFDN